MHEPASTYKTGLPDGRFHRQNRQNWRFFEPPGDKAKKLATGRKSGRYLAIFQACWRYIEIFGEIGDFWRYSCPKIGIPGQKLAIFGDTAEFPQKSDFIPSYRY